MSALNRAFTRKEIAVILLLTLVLLVMVYYRVVYVPVQNRLEELDTTELETEIMLEQARAAKIAQMLREIEEGHETYAGVVYSYDNQEGEINALNNIFKTANTFSVTTRSPVLTDKNVRRTMEIQFSADTYRIAERMIQQLYDCPYRCLVSNVTISPFINGLYLSDAQVSCSVTVTFHETTVGANTTVGLPVQSNNAA